MDVFSPRFALRITITRLDVSFMVKLLCLAVVVSVSNRATADDNSTSDESINWRTTPQFQSANRSILSLLKQEGGANATNEWREIVGQAPRAARLGPSLIDLMVSLNDRLPSVLAEPNREPPLWLTKRKGAASLQLAIAERWFFTARYEAVLVWLEGVDREKSYSPELASYLRAAAYHQLVDYPLAKQTAGQLADSENRLGLARRSVLQQIRRDLKAVPKELALITRQMDDVSRRLAQEGADDATQERQQEIVDSLEKMIEQLEEQQKQQQQASAAAGGAGGSSSPAEESRPAEQKGPGEVGRARLVGGGEWGSLPPAERERLTQAITRDYPAHYRSLVEDYFRTLADPVTSEQQPSSVEVERRAQ